ncbi:MAG TPA: cytochrome D1 domain-containing protein [Saprospiraceae bacterium]|nr:cytochrome D1 domain-containing protein [Saprospiraceae bacterium]
MRSIRKFLSTRFIIACTLLAAAIPVSNGQQSLLALSKADHVLAIIDPVTLEIKARIPVGQDPHEVIASPDGKTAYVTIYGGGSLHELNVIDLINQKPLKNIDTRPLWGPHGIEFVEGKVWFSAEGSKAVGRYDPESNSLDWSMGTGEDRTHMLYVRSDGKEIYTTNVNGGTVSILTAPEPPASTSQPGPPRPRNEWTQTVIPTARGSEGFDVSPDGQELWTASSDNGQITIIDLSAKKQSAQFDAQTQGANRLKFTPDGSMVFITSLRQGDAIIFDAKTRKEIKRLPIGHGAAGIQMDPDGKRAFLACTPDNDIVVVDLGTLTITGHIALGGPDGMAWAKQ